MTYGKRKLGHIEAPVKKVGGINFETKNKFRTGEIVDGVKIAWLGPNFVKNFLEQTENNIVSGDTEERTLAEFWELLKKQGRRQSGNLLVNIRDVNDKIRPVNTYWSAISGGGWSIEAGSVVNPYKLNPVGLVVSR